MRIQYPAGSERKKLAAIMARILEAKSIYAGMPTAQYEVGGYILSREVILTGPDNRVLVKALRQQGYRPTDETYDSDLEIAAEPETEEASQLDRLAIEVPLADYPADAINRLRKLVDSKATLLKMALSVDELPVNIEQERISLPWFPCDGNATAYAQLVTALCRTAKEKQRVNTRPQKEYPNPKFTMRCWLTTTLGLVGDDYRQIRKLMCGPLEGNSAWSTGADPRKDTKVAVVENSED